MTMTLTIDGKPVTATAVTVSITTAPPAAPTLTVGPGKMFPTIATAAAAATSGCTILVDPVGSYRESVLFNVPLTIKSSTAGKKVVVDASGGLPLINDQAVFVFERDYVVTDFEIFGAVGVNSVNAASIRNDAAIGCNGTITNAHLHGSQTPLLHTGGTLIVDSCDLDHNTGGNQEHLLYHAQFGSVVPLLTKVTNSRLWHCANGSLIKSNAVNLQVDNCQLGTIAVPAGTSTLRPGATGNPAWMTPPPTTPAGSEWLVFHTGCSSNGYPYDAPGIDYPHGGMFTVTNSRIFTGGSSGYLIAYGNEGSTNGNGGGTISGCTFFIERGTSYIGNRVPNSTITISKSSFVGGVFGPPVATLDCTDASGQPVPGAQIILTP